MRRVVLESHTASYPDPIRVTAGDTVRLFGKTDVWDGFRWLWAEAQDGRAGWLPDAYVASEQDRTYAVRDYSAVELTCQKGEVLVVMDETHGWAWCRSRDGAQGWAPLRNLSRPMGDRESAD